MRTIITLCLAVALTSSCKRSDRVGASSEGTAPASSTFRMAYVATVDALPFYVAQQRGLFEEVGMDVRLDRYAAQMDIDTALVGGSADGAFTDIVRVAQLEKKYGVKLDIITQTEAQWTLVSNKVARLNKLEQMGDKMVAMTRFSATDYLTDKTFNGVKKTLPHFKVQINDIALRLKMLLNNEMDALWLPEPFATEALMAGHKELVRSESYGLKLGVIALRQEKKTDAEQLTKVYSMACDSINKYGLEAYRDELQMYCGIDSATINHLPPMTFTHAAKPSDKLLNEIENYLTTE